MANYFKYFPVTPYTFDGTNIQFVRNILNKANFESDFKENTVVYYEYLVGDEETPEIVSHKVYGSPDKHWIILMLNDMIHPQFDWPLSNYSFRKFVDLKYRQQQYANSSIEGDGTIWAQTNIKEYNVIETKINKDLNDVISIERINVTSNVYANTGSSSEDYVLQDGTNITVKIEKQAKTYYDYEEEENENKRSIKILKPEFVFAVEQEFASIFR